MKAAKIIYMIMNVTMIAACVAMAVIDWVTGFNILYLIAPVLILTLFAFVILQKEENDLKKLMNVIFSAHIAVMATIIQGIVVFKVGAVNAVVLILLSAALLTFMIWALRRMFKKINELETLSTQESSAEKTDEPVK